MGSARAETLATELRARGAACEVTSIARLRQGLQVEHVVCDWDAPDDDADRAIRVAIQGLEVVGALGDTSGHEAPRLWWITRRAMGVAADDRPAVSSSSIWGLGRTVMQERPELRCTLMDLDEDQAVADALASELGAADDEENQIAWRGRQRYVARLARADSAEPKARRPLAGTALVTGGLGSLGKEVARGLAKAGVRHLVLTGRRGPETPGAGELVAELEALGARITLAAVDVTDREGLARIIDAIPAELPLRTVVHAAGVIDDGLLSEQTPERFERVMAPKVAGAWNLHLLTQGIDLDAFVLFSSIAGSLGSAAQGAYSAANAFLDGLAERRRAQGLAALSLGWGPWAGKGMAASLDHQLRARFARQGIGMLEPERGVALLTRLIDRPEARLLVVPLDLESVARAFGPSVPAIWRSLVTAPAQDAGGAGKAWGREVAALSPERRSEAARELVRGEVARLLSLEDANEISLDKPFKDLGFDSLMAVELRNALGRLTGIKLPATVAYDQPTPGAIAEYLLRQAGKEPGERRRAERREAPLEPIAIVGIGCRYPGGITDAESFWRLVDSGGDAITEIQRPGWDLKALYDPDPDAAGRMSTRYGGLLRDIDRFDARFFGISAQEAGKLDPQQRLLLETSWEALEHAGVPADSLKGSDTGVFVGMSYLEYATLVGRDALDGYVGTGSAASVASGRISYVLGLQGPSMTVDTACSSSLVTLHLACQALRQGECSMALAGGVALMLTPTAFVEFSRLRVLAPDGRCKSFSAGADGTGWSEGCGMLVLERLSDARRNGHPVLALVKGTAVNQDGRSNGLTAPNGPSQEAVIRQALERSNVAPAEVGYVECHGTGTALGDPIEAQALGAALSEGRSRDNPVLIGSVKTNLGHTQAAAGAAGIIKTVLALQHERIPGNLHFSAPSPHIAWDELPVKVASVATPWPRSGGRRIAGVSSFGISGTNAHVLIEEAPAAPTEKPVSARAGELVVLSARTSDALTAAAGRLADHLESHPGIPLGDLAYSLLATRSSLECRLALPVDSQESLIGRLRSVAVPADHPVVSTRDMKIAFVFPGQGSQWLGMGRALLKDEPVFREALEACDRAVRAETGWSVIDELHATTETSRLERMDVVQPVLFSIQVALSALWRSWGIEPRAVVGHSMGEVAAACVAGALSIEDAAAVICRRTALTRKISGQGQMALVELSLEDTVAALAGLEAKLSVAASNGKRQTVISGEPGAMGEVLGKLEARGVFCRLVRVDFASHSPQIDPLLPELVSRLQKIEPRRSSVPMRSTVTGEELSGLELTAQYWADNLRKPVRFADAVEGLVREGITHFVEISPHPILTTAVDDIRRETGISGLSVGSLKRDQPERLTLLENLGSLHVHGYPLDPARLFPPASRRANLPTYPWQRKRYWVEEPVPGEGRASGNEDALLERLAGQGVFSEKAREVLPEILRVLADERDTSRRTGTLRRSLHTLSWKNVAAPPSPGKAGANWWIFGDPSETRVLAAALESAGARTRAFEKEAALISGLGSSGAAGEEIAGLIYVAPRGETGERMLAVERALAAGAAGAPRAWWITRGAVGTSDTDAPTHPDHAALWGLARTFALEHPGSYGGVIDLPGDSGLDAALAERITAQVCAPRDESPGTPAFEDQLALRGSASFVPRIVPYELAPNFSYRFRPNRTALVTGGTGALGLHVAKWLARKGQANLVLVSRRGDRAPGVKESVEELQALGARVTVVAADVADREAMAEVLHGIPPDFPLGSVFHTAGLADRTFLKNLTEERYREVVSSKRDGTWVLDELTKGHELDAFVCFSSIAGVWGSGSQAAYAAANAFLDSWAQGARAKGCRALAVAWGPWAGGGMADGSAMEQLEKRGLKAMEPETGLLAIEHALHRNLSHCVVADVTWEKFAPSFEAWGPRAMLNDVRKVMDPEEPSNAAGPSLKQSLEEIPPEERRAHLADWVAAQVADILGRTPDQVDRKGGFFDLGMDSLMVVELRRRLERALGRSVPTGAAFANPNIEALSTYLIGRQEGEQRDDPRPIPKLGPVEPASGAQNLDTDEDVLKFIESRYEVQENE